MDAYDAKYTRRGTERVIRKPEPATPHEGFADLLGQQMIDDLVVAAQGGAPVEAATFLKVNTRYACGFVQSGPRRIFFTLLLKAAGAEIYCYGCDPVFATPPHKRIDYNFEPYVDPEWSFQMRHEVKLRYEMVRATHEKQAIGMNIALHFGENPRRARRTWDAYAKKHGLVIVEKEVVL